MGQDTPRQFGATFTLDRINKFLPKSGSVLEVGCGDGSVAAGLMKLGLKVVAIDPAAEAITSARARGVDAHQVGFLEFDGGRFDVVLFTRSLHHIHALDRVIAKAHQWLAPGGKLIAVDFDHAAMDAKTAAWFYGLEGILKGTDGVSSGPLEKWKAEHSEHHLSTGAEMEAVIHAQFGAVLCRKGPYLFRYFLPDLPESSAAVARRIAAWEESLLSLGSLTPIGLQLVARR